VDEEDAAERPAYLGFVDVLDILHGLLATLPTGMGHDPQHWRHQLEQAAPPFLARRLVMLSSHNDGALVFAAHSGMSMLDLIRDGFLGGGDGKSPSLVTHRVAVFDSTGQVTHIVSQSDVISFLAATPHALESFGDATLEQLRMGHARGGVAQVARALPTVEALLFMRSQGVSSVAVVDDASGGALCGNLSGSDVRGIAGGDMHELALPVETFLRSRKGGPSELVTATRDSALRTVVHRMAAGRVHRVYVVEPQTRRPVGIVTCTDVLRAIVALDSGG
jgi:CBS domain-containing protein